MKYLAFFLIFAVFMSALIPMSEYPRWFQNISDPQKGYDLIQHVGAFALLYLFVWKEVFKTSFKLRAVVLGISLTLAVSALLELSQNFTGRVGSWEDMGANCLGVFIAVLCVFVLEKVKSGRPQDKREGN